ncbi:small proline-rich protein 2H-like [Senna tora]|uniref:Small proline-rich protein 2H-like n=1 Tax=Senna tora TaxID=362788 RepID=A0A834T3W1_9FABA|nr:small proline-rich protein 2H-like [Senna tora]
MASHSLRLSLVTLFIFAIIFSPSLPSHAAPSITPTLPRPIRLPPGTPPIICPACLCCAPPPAPGTCCPCVCRPA